MDIVNEMQRQASLLFREYNVPDQDNIKQAFEKQDEPLDELASPQGRSIKKQSAK